MVVIVSAKPSAQAADVIPLREAAKSMARIAALSFGGPAGQIAA
jgi:chromate transport protein ChrA